MLYIECLQISDLIFGPNLFIEPLDSPAGRLDIKPWDEFSIKLTVSHCPASQWEQISAARLHILWKDFYFFWKPWKAIIAAYCPPPIAQAFNVELSGMCMTFRCLNHSRYTIRMKALLLQTLTADVLYLVHVKANRKERIKSMQEHNRFHPVNTSSHIKYIYFLNASCFSPHSPVDHLAQ